MWHRHSATLRKGFLSFAAQSSPSLLIMCISGLTRRHTSSKEPPPVIYFILIGCYFSFIKGVRVCRVGWIFTAKVFYGMGCPSPGPTLLSLLLWHVGPQYILQFCVVSPHPCPPLHTAEGWRAGGGGWHHLTILTSGVQKLWIPRTNSYVNSRLAAPTASLIIVWPRCPTQSPARQSPISAFNWLINNLTKGKKPHTLTDRASTTQSHLNCGDVEANLNIQFIISTTHQGNDDKIYPTFPSRVTQATLKTGITHRRLCTQNKIISPRNRCDTDWHNIS